MRNKKNPKQHQPQTPPSHAQLQSFIQDLSLPPPWVAQGDGEWGLQSIHNSSSLPLLPPHTFPPLQHGASPWVQRLEHLFPSFDLGVHTAVSHNFFSPHLLCLCSVLPFLKPVLCEVAPSCLRGSDMSCGGSIGAGWVQLCPTQGSPWPHRGHPCRPNLATCTHYSFPSVHFSWKQRLLHVHMYGMSAACRTFYCRWDELSSVLDIVEDKRNRAKNSGAIACKQP